MGLKFCNFGKAQVAAPPSDIVGLSFTVQTGMGLYYPVLGAGDYFYGIFKNAAGEREIVKVSARSGDVMTIAPGCRGMDGTTPKTWVIGDYFVAGIVNAALLDSIANPNIVALASLNAVADTAFYYTGPGVAALYSLTPFARSLLVGGDASAMQATLGVPSAAANTAAIATAVAALIPSGTKMLFLQAAAPAGWTQNVTALNHALRVTGGAGGGTGGSATFTATFASRPITGTNSAVILSATQMPSHTHSVTQFSGGGGSRAFSFSSFSSAPTTYTVPLDPVGNGDPHNHAFTGTALNMAVQYIDSIICTKN